MRVKAQIQEDNWNHAYIMFIPNNDARRWATYVLKKLQVQRQYISRRQGYLTTGDLDFIARYTGMINNDQHRALITTYLPFAPVGLQYSCPTCG